MLNFCDFIQVYVFTTNHHLNFHDKEPVASSQIFGIGNRTRFTPFLYSTVRRFLLSAPPFLCPTISRYFYVWGT